MRKVKANRSSLLLFLLVLLIFQILNSFKGSNFAPTGEFDHRALDPIHTASSGAGMSKHPDWQLWHEMSPSHQEIALERAFARAKPYGTLLGKKRRMAPVTQSFEKYHTNCSDGKRPTVYGAGGEHMVCGPIPSKEGEDCHFLSYGIRDDPSFDIQFSKATNCRGFAGDPSIVHPSKLSPTVTFHNVGLKLLRPNVEQKRDPEDDWILASLPQTRQYLGWDYLDFIKIDCEGCEIAMARDILAEDASFLDHVGQISIETHANRNWVDSKEELYYYALMFPLLEDAGFKLIWSSIFGCGRWETTGCMPEMMSEMDMSCGSRDPRGKPNSRVPVGWSCHDWLWAKV